METYSSIKEYRKNRFIIFINQLSAEYNELTKKFNSIYFDAFDMDNVVEIYRNKIFDIAEEVEAKSLDFWGDDFIIRDAIRLRLESQIEEILSILNDVSDRIDRFPSMVFVNGTLNDLSLKVILPKIKRVNEIAGSINNYSLRNDLDNILFEFYDDLSPSIMNPNDYRSSYADVKKCLQKLGLSSELEGKDSKIIDLIEKKESQCVKRDGNIDMNNVVKSISSNNELKQLVDKTIPKYFNEEMENELAISLEKIRPRK